MERRERGGGEEGSGWEGEEGSGTEGEGEEGSGGEPRGREGGGGGKWRILHLGTCGHFIKITDTLTTSLAKCLTSSKWHKKTVYFIKCYHLMFGPSITT